MLLKNRRFTYIHDITAVAICTAMIVISSWLCIPFGVNFTLQTLAIFTISATFSLKHSLLSVIVYLLMGICGAPVFSGFGAGLSAVVGPTGGFLVSFVFVPVIISFLGKISRAWLIISMVISTLICYLLGTLWYVAAYGEQTSGGIFSVLLLCVFPFIIPDAIKIALAYFISIRLSKIMPKIF